MTTPPRPAYELQVGERVAQIVSQLFFGTGLGVCLVGALTFGLVPLGLGTGRRELLVAACLVAAGAFAWSTRLMRRTGSATASLLAGWGGIALVLLVSVVIGEGVRAPLLGFTCIVICVVCVTAGLRHGLVMAAAAVAIVLALAWAELAHWLRAPAALPLLVPVLTQLLMVVCSVSTGLMILRITEQYLGAAAEREQRFHELLQIAVDWYWELDENFRFVFVSEPPNSPPIAGRRAMLGHAPWETRLVELNAAELDANRADLESHRPFHGLLLRVATPGGLRYQSISGAPRFDSRGVFRGYWGVSRDVTAQLRAQFAMTASEARYRGLFERSPSPLLLHRNGRVIDANTAAARMFGLADRGAMVGFNLREAATDGDSRGLLARHIAQLESLPPGEGVPVAEFRLRSRDGRELSVQATGVRVDAADGPATLSIYFDVSARVDAEAALRRSEAMLSLVFSTSPDYLTLSDVTSGRYLLVNDAFTRLTGYTADEAIGRTAGDLGIWADPNERRSFIEAMLAHGRINEVPAVFLAKSGTRLPMLVSASRFAMDGRDHIVVIARDMTEAERQRVEREAIFENASVGVAFTRDRYFVQANPAVERILGWSPGALPGQSTRAVVPSDAEQDEISAELLQRIGADEPLELVRELVRRDGSRVWCRILAKAVDPAHPVKGGTIWIVEDITQKRQVDQALAAARDAALAASRAKSAFLANTSHEIRTPLNGLLGLARLAMQDGLDAPRRQQYLRQIVDSAEGLAAIISDILDLSKIEAGKITLEAVPFNLHETLQALHRTYLPLAEAKGLQLELHIDAALPAAYRADPVRVRQILSNFLNNALKFTDRGDVRMAAAPGAPGRVRIVIADTGCGIDAATQARLFVPFSQADDSTTRRFGGTGLGLSICRELATLMGGDVGVDSRPDQGSSFWVELPLAEAAPEDAVPEPQADDLSLLQGLRVLMVEDNPVNMLIGAAMLEQWGVEVVQAVDGQLALDAVEHAVAGGRPFDLVLMDVQMPGMSGHEAARRLRVHHDAATLPIVALTAAALVSERDEALAAGMDDFLSKPIDTRKLRQALLRFGVRHRALEAGA